MSVFRSRDSERAAAALATAVLAFAFVAAAAGARECSDSDSSSVPQPQERTRTAGSERFWEAVEALRAQEVETLLRAGEPPDPRRGPPPGETPLLRVTREGCSIQAPGPRAAAIAIALALIHHGADVNAAGDNNLTPLLSASDACPPEVVVALMRAGADTRARTAGGASALQLASIANREDNVRALLDAGYDVWPERDQIGPTLSGKPNLQALLEAELARLEPAVHLQEIAVRARLDASGVVHATERVSLTAVNDVAVAERSFRTLLHAEVRVSRVTRLDDTAAAVRVLISGSLDAADRYEVVDGDLRWSLRAAGDPGFARGKALTYQIDYMVSGAVMPIWGVRPFGAATIAFASPLMLHPLARIGELWQAWRLAPGGWSSRYALDHDFSPFPLLGGKPLARATLDLAIDPAWSVREPLQREWLRVGAEDAVRVFIPLDFRGTGAPAAADRPGHAALLGPLLALPVASLGLWMALFFGRWRRRRRFDRTVVDEAWIRLHVLTKAPDEVARAFTQNVRVDAPAILEQMEREGKIEFDDRARGGTLRLRAPRGMLTPWERAVVERLFREADVIDRETLEGRLPLDLDGPARRAFRAASARQTLRSFAFVPTLALVVFGLGAMVSAPGGGGFQAVVVTVVSASVVYGISRRAAARWGNSPALPLIPLAALILVPLALCAAAFAFFVTVPAYPRVMAGLAAVWIGVSNSVFNHARLSVRGPETEFRYALAKARGYFAGELRKPYPSLDDAWLPWMMALDLGNEVAAWRQRKPSEVAAAMPDPAAYAALGRWSGGTAAAPGWAARFLRTG